MKIHEKLVAVSLVLAGATSLGHADEKAHDFYFQQNQQRFVTQTQDARMFGMGGSTALTAANSVSTVTNPAGLGMMKYGDVSASYSYNEVSGNDFPTGGRVKDKQNWGQVYGATPLGPVKDSLPDYGNLGLGWYGRYGNWNPDQTSTDSSTYQGSAGYGKAIGDKTSLGYSLTYQNDSISSDRFDYGSTNSFLHNVGVQYRDSEDLVWGATVTLGHGKHDLRFPQGVRGQSVDQFSAGVATGLEYQADDTTSVAVGVDYTYYDNNGDNNVVVSNTVWGGDSTGHAGNARVGIEERINDWFAVRAGYRYAANFNWNYKRDDLSELDGSAKYNAWSGGAGVNYAFDRDSFIQSVRLDYGVEYRDVGNGDWQHLITLATPFDLCM